MSKQIPLFDASDEAITRQPLEPIPPAKDGTPPEQWLGGVHPDGFLELTRGFYLYADQLNRALHFLAHDRAKDQALYQQLVTATGMSKAQVEAYMQHATAMQLLAPRKLAPTPFGYHILESDPFFDQPGTLWLLHYFIASNPGIVVWNYLCNAILPSVEQISPVEARDQFLPFSGRWSESSIRVKVRKELRAIFADYTAEFFARLDYLREEERNEYLVNHHVTPVPPFILLAAVLIYRDRFMPGASSVEIATLVYAEHSPGRILRQNELKIRQALNTLHESRWLTIESRANLDQIRFRSNVSWLDAVLAYWESAA